MGRIGKHKYIKMRVKKNPHLNPKQLAACTGKIRYSKHDRERALEGRPDFVKFYKCKFCQFYHLGRRKEAPSGKRRKT